MRSCARKDTHHTFRTSYANMTDAIDAHTTTGGDDDAPTAAYASLSKVMSRVRAVLSPALDRPFWLRAELSAANERDGVFYGEVVETDRNGTVIAKLRFVIWSQDLQKIRARFAKAGLEWTLDRGTAIGVQCVVRFHEVHGLSLQVRDMDPRFVLGELELRRRRILAHLERDGLVGRNAQRPLPLLPNRVLLITSGTSAAFHDFTRTLAGRRFGVRIWLADAVVQGPETERSVLAALAVASHVPVDLVVLIRGGGSKTDLGWLDNEAIARAIAMLHVPVWTGIGHEIDTSVLDAVAAKAFRTPTAVAEAIAARFEGVAAFVEEAESRLRATFASSHRTQQERLARNTDNLRQGTQKLLTLRRSQLTSHTNQFSVYGTRRVTAARATWAGRAEHLQRLTIKRLRSAHHQLQDVQGKLPAYGRRALEHKANALGETSRRLQLSRVTQRLDLERAALTRGRSSLHRASLQGLAAARTELQTNSSLLRSHVGTRLSSARLALVPKAQRLRGGLALRIEAAASRLAAMQERLTGAANRELLKTRTALMRARAGMSPQVVKALCDRQRAQLEEHARLIRASDPQRALARGFSLTYTAAGRLVRGTQELTPGQLVTTHLANGTFDAVVKSTQEGTTDGREE
jgi:exodeoxyribonuclease VII large subunit